MKNSVLNLLLLSFLSAGTIGATEAEGVLSEERFRAMNQIGMWNYVLSSQKSMEGKYAFMSGKENYLPLYPIESSENPQERSAASEEDALASYVNYLDDNTCEVKDPFFECLKKLCPSSFIPTKNPPFYFDECRGLHDSDGALQIFAEDGHVLTKEEKKSLGTRVIQSIGRDTSKEAIKRAELILERISQNKMFCLDLLALALHKSKMLKDLYDSVYSAWQASKTLDRVLKENEFSAKSDPVDKQTMLLAVEQEKKFKSEVMEFGGTVEQIECTRFGNFKPKEGADQRKLEDKLCAKYPLAKSAQSNQIDRKIIQNRQEQSLEFWRDLVSIAEQSQQNTQDEVNWGSIIDTLRNEYTYVSNYSNGAVEEYSDDSLLANQENLYSRNKYFVEYKAECILRNLKMALFKNSDTITFCMQELDLVKYKKALIQKVWFPENESQ